MPKANSNSVAVATSEATPHPNQESTIAAVQSDAAPKTTYPDHTFTAGGRVREMHDQIVKSFEVGLKNNEAEAQIAAVSPVHRLEAFASAAFGYFCLLAALAALGYLIL